MICYRDKANENLENKYIKLLNKIKIQKCVFASEKQIQERKQQEDILKFGYNLKHQFM